MRFPAGLTLLLALGAGTARGDAPGDEHEITVGGDPVRVSCMRKRATWDSVLLVGPLGASHESLRCWIDALTARGVVVISVAMPADPVQAADRLVAVGAAVTAAADGQGKEWCPADGHAW